MEHLLLLLKSEFSWKSTCFGCCLKILQIRLRNKLRRVKETSVRSLRGSFPDMSFSHSSPPSAVSWLPCSQSRHGESRSGWVKPCRGVDDCTGLQHDKHLSSHHSWCHSVLSRDFCRCRISTLSEKGKMQDNEGAAMHRVTDKGKNELYSVKNNESFVLLVAQRQPHVPLVKGDISVRFSQHLICNSACHCQHESNVNRKIISPTIQKLKYLKQLNFRASELPSSLLSEKNLVLNSRSTLYCLTIQAKRRQ